MAVGRWYRVPFVVGHHIGDQDGIINQDGYIACFLTFLLLTALGIGGTISAWITESKHFGIKMADLDLFLVLYMLVSCILVITMCKKRFGDGRGVDAPSSGMSMTDRIRQLIKHKLPLIGIVFFFVPSMIMDIFTVSAYAECLHVMYGYGTKLYEYVSIILFRMFRVAFMGSLVGFALIYHQKRFTRKSVTIRYILMIILASTISMWFETMVHDFSEVYHNSTQPEMSGSDRTIQDPSNHSLSEKTLECWNGTTTQILNLEKLSGFVYPLNIEFALLVVELVAHLYFSISHKSGRRKRRHRGRRPQPAQSDDGQVENQLDESSTEINRTSGKQKTSGADGEEYHSPDADEQEPPLEEHPAPKSESNLSVSPTSRDLHPESLRSSLKKTNTGRIRKGKQGVRIEQPRRHTGVSNSYSEHSDNEQTQLLKPGPSTSGRGQSRPDLESSGVSTSSSAYTTSTDSIRMRHVRMYCCVLLALFINSVLFTMSMLAFYCFDTDTFHITYHGFNALYYAMVIIFIFVVLKKSERFVSRFQPYSGLEMMVVMSVAGCFLYATMGLTAYCAYLADTSQNSTNKYREGGIALVDKLLELFFMFLQTTFMLHATRIQAPPGEDQARGYMKQCLIFLAISNISIWTVDSFFKVQDLENLDSYKLVFYGTQQWHLITHTLLPFIIFYRFNSFFILLGGFLDH